MQPTTATVAKDGQLHLAEELLCALGIPDGGEIDIILRDGCVELRKKRDSNAQGIDYLPDIFHAGDQPAAGHDDAVTRARRQDEDYARRTSGC